MDAYESSVGRPFRAFLLGDCISRGGTPGWHQVALWGSAEFSA